MNRLSKKAFTLIELLVVIAIIGILSGLIAVGMNGATGAAEDAKRKAHVNDFKKALLAIYTFNNMSYPIQTVQCNIGDTTSAGCLTLNSFLSPEYFSTIPTDPSGSYYTYQSSTNGKSFTISTDFSNGDSYVYSSVSGSSNVSCGETVNFTYNGSSVTYGTVVSQAGKCWMDRNLGASQVATVYNDPLAYGDLFQWGRLDDGHQDRSSATTTTLSDTDIPIDGNFIINPVTPYDWRSTANNALWQGTSGINNPCPSGWRLPTLTEWNNEIAAGSWTDRNSAYASPLKLTIGGYRPYSTGVLKYVGSYGYYWSSTISTNSRSYYFYNYTGTTSRIYRASGYSVRCIKD